MKKVFKILLTIFLVFAIVSGAVVVWQWENIKSITLGVRENSEQIEQRRNENQEKLVKDVNVFMDKPIREMTEEEKKQIKDGEVTLNDVYQKIFEEKIEEETKSVVSQPETDEKNITKNSPSTEKEEGSPEIGNNSPEGKTETQETKPATNEEKQPSETVPKETKDQIVSRYMVELYKLQNEFNARAEATIASGGSYYESIKTHEHDASARAATISKYTPIVRGVESECDARVEAIVQSLEAELVAIGADTSVIATIRATYANEKQLKLSYYANKYLK